MLAHKCRLSLRLGCAGGKKLAQSLLKIEITDKYKYEKTRAMQKQKRSYMQLKIRTGNLVSSEQLKEMLEDKNFKLFTSKQLAEILNLKSDAALRKQRSKGRSLFGYTRVGRQIYYPVDLVVETLHKNVVEAKLR